MDVPIDLGGSRHRKVPTDGPMKAGEGPISWPMQGGETAAVKLRLRGLGYSGALTANVDFQLFLHFSQSEVHWPRKPGRSRPAAHHAFV